LAARNLLSPIPVLTAQRTNIEQETPEQRLLAAETDNLAKLFFVSGRVQGVGYRYFVQREAARLGIDGYAENLDDGRVEVYAIGSADALASLLTALRKGPTFAKVSSVDEEVAQIDPRYSNQFVI
jgi:acylphosphatase